MTRHIQLRNEDVMYSKISRGTFAEIYDKNDARFGKAGLYVRAPKYGET